MPGAAVLTASVVEVVWPLLLTTRVACPAGTSYGIWQLIWSADTYHNGAAIPFTVIATPAIVTGSGVEPATWVASAKCEPKSERIAPGAYEGANDAAFAAAVIAGAVTAGLLVDALIASVAVC